MTGPCAFREGLSETDCAEIQNVLVEGSLAGWHLRGLAVGTYPSKPDQQSDRMMFETGIQSPVFPFRK
jgi:hypothetical protein